MSYEEKLKEMGLLRLEKDHQQRFFLGGGQKKLEAKKKEMTSVSSLCIGKEIIGLKLIRSSGTQW